MKINRSLLSAPFLFLVLFLVVSGTPVLKTFALADESIAALQRDVILAKEKDRAVAVSMNAMPAKIDTSKKSVLQAEAQRLIQELLDKDISGSERAGYVAEPITPEKKISEIKLKPAPKKPEVKKRGGWPWLKAMTGGYKDFQKIEDGLALYKVAVSDGKITLKETKEIGLATSLSLQAYMKKVEVAEAKLVEAKRALFPTVQGLLEYNSGLASDVPGEDPHGRYYKGKNYKLNVTQPVFYGGELVFTVKQAEENVNISKGEYLKAKNEYLQQIETAFYGLLKAEYNVQYQLELYEVASTVRKRVRREHQEQLVSEVDYLNLESRYQEAFFQIESAKNDLVSADITLHQTLNLDSSQPFPADLQLHFNKIDPDYDQMLALAFRQNPEMILRQAQVESAAWSLKVFKAKKLPHVDLRGSIGKLGEIFKDTAALEQGKADLDTEREWFLGMQASMPFGPNSVTYEQQKNVFGPTVLALTGSESYKRKVAFNLFDKFADITDEKAAQAALIQAEADMTKAQSDLTLKVREAFYNLQKSLIQIDSSIAKVRYQQKQNSIAEYMLSIQETTAALYVEGINDEQTDKFAFIQAVADYNLAISALGASIGDFDYFDRQPEPETV